MRALLWLAIGLYGVSLLALGAAARQNREDVEGFSRFLLFAVFGLHTLLLLIRVVKAGHAPPSCQISKIRLALASRTASRWSTGSISVLAKEPLVSWTWCGQSVPNITRSAPTTEIR